MSKKIRQKQRNKYKRIKSQAIIKYKNLKKIKIKKTRTKPKKKTKYNNKIIFITKKNIQIKIKI